MMGAMRTGTLRISQVGLRGVVGAGLTARHGLDFAAAFGTFLPRGKPILLGRDPRASGTMLRQGVIAALLAAGHDVIDLGVVSTPVIQHAIRRRDAGGAVSIGASHNAAEWNALKFFGPRGTYLSTAEASELLDIYHLRLFTYAEWTGIGRLCCEEGAIDAYLDDLAAVYDLDGLRPLRVVADCCNGTSAPILRRLCRRFGLDWVLINERIEGVRFAHEPSISARTAELQLAPLVCPLRADAGFLFDIDSDRVALATEAGVAASEEMILPLLADYLLPRRKGKLVITNLSTTALVDWVAEQHGGTVLRVPVGRQAAIDVLALHQADEVAVAGEGSGAVMMPQFRFVYDGIASMLGILSLRQERDEPLSGILGRYPAYDIRKAELPLSPQGVPDLMRALRETYREGAADTTDGLRVDFADEWFHVRVSQTEPVVRLICEARGRAPQPLFSNLMETVRSFA